MTKEYDKRESNLFGPEVLSKVNSQGRGGGPPPKRARFDTDRNELCSFLSRGTPAQYGGRTAPAAVYSSYTRAQSTVNGQRVSDFSQVPANQKPTGGKPQTSKQLPCEETLQDGRDSFTKQPGAARRLDGIHRFERCIYLSVTVAEEHRKYLRFQWENQLYEFLCLPFGLSSTPHSAAPHALSQSCSGQ